MTIARDSAETSGKAPPSGHPPKAAEANGDRISFAPPNEPLTTLLEHQPPAAIESLRRTIREQLSEQEVTFNILGVPEGTYRPWQLDPLPLVLDHADYVALGSGLKQRARLLELILEDLYGPARLLKSGLLPPSLVLENPRFWRTCHGWMRPRLYLYAADVSRDPSGAFAVYSDRTAAPAGAGYALENRLVLGRTLPNLFRRYSVLKVKRFFQYMRETIERMAPTAAQGPRVVVLTPGAQDESSFEHAYLARYLGYELVEGRDLTVRDDTVYMKTLSGLKRVDVVLRRVFDDYCDPLELRSDSTLGVAGLLSAARSGRVSIANPLGTALVESPAFKAYLPRLCRALLGEDLELSSVPTHWCGDPESLRYVLAHLDELTIKPAFRDRSGEPVHAAKLPSGEREALIRKLMARPAQFVAEQWEPTWTATYWGGSSLVRGQVSLRAFLCAQGDDFDLMPSGLARIDSAPDGIFLSLSTDQTIKDVWIPSPTPTHDQPLPAMPDQRVELRRGGIDLPSRLLDDVFWLGRYIERADNTARLVRAGLERIGSETPSDPSPVLESLLESLDFLEVILLSDPGAPKAARPRTAESLLFGAISDAKHPGTIHAVLGRVHALTLRVRTRLSRDAWHVLRRLPFSIAEIEEWQKAQEAGAAIALLDRLLIRLAAVNGAVLDNMVRGHAWVFMDMGRRVERGVYILTLLRRFLPAGASRSHMEALLEILDSLLTYRARYLSSLQIAPVVDLLLTDESNPHSLRYQVDHIKFHLDRLPRESEAQRGLAERRMVRIQAELITADVYQLCSGNGDLLRRSLEETIAEVFRFSDDLTQRFFSHAEASHALAPPAWLSEDPDVK